MHLSSSRLRKWQALFFTCVPVLAFACASTQTPSALQPATRSSASAISSNSVAPVASGAPSNSSNAAQVKDLIEPLSTGSQGALFEQLAGGDAAVVRGDVTAASAAYERAKALAPQAAEPLVGLARVQLLGVASGLELNSSNANEPATKAALQLVQQALTRSPNLAAAYAELGRVYVLMGKPQEALDSLNQAKKLGAVSAETRSCAGLALVALGRGDEAISDLAAAVKLDAKNPVRHRTLGAVLLSRAKAADAVVALEEADRLGPNNSRTLSDLGACYLAIGQIERGVTALEQSIALEPNRVGALINLSYGYAVKGDLNKAEAASKKATELAPNRASGWISLGGVLLRKKDKIAAKKAFETALRLDPDDPRAKDGIDACNEGEPKSAPNKTKNK